MSQQVEQVSPRSTFTPIPSWDLGIPTFVRFKFEGGVLEGREPVLGPFTHRSEVERCREKIERALGALNRDFGFKAGAVEPEKREVRMDDCEQFYSPNSKPPHFCGKSVEKLMEELKGYLYNTRSMPD